MNKKQLVLSLLLIEMLGYNTIIEKLKENPRNSHWIEKLLLHC